MKSIQVRATRRGYGGLPGHHNLREEGDVFEVLEEHFSKRWMDKTGETIDQTAEPAEEGLSKKPVAELREMAEARGIAHEGVKKAELAAAIEAHDNPAEVQ